MLKTGDTLEDKYRIVNLLGNGGWGYVYLAENIRLGNRWAIKEIDLCRSEQLNLLAEPEILKKMNHSSLPRIIDILRNDSFLYIVEDYFEGERLSRLIELRTACHEGNAVRWAGQLCRILIYLHSFKPYPVIYRDMKPDNIIIDADNNVKLVDFGIAREFKPGRSGDTTFIGTRGYAAPEQFCVGSQSDERTDIYGLGATLYHVLTGISPNKPPYRMVPVRQIDRALSAAIERIVARCVESDPKLRYQSASDLLRDLDSLELNPASGTIKGLFQKILKQITDKTGSNYKAGYAPGGRKGFRRACGATVIAVGGTDRGVGCTHTSIALAVFLARLRFRVAITEFNDNPVFYTLEDEKSGKGMLKNCFRRSGVDFFKKDTRPAEVLRAGYEYIVLDLGRLGWKGSPELNRLFTCISGPVLPVTPDLGGD